MADKFQAHYRLLLNWTEDDKPQQAIVQDPITIQFNVTKAVMANCNTARIQVTNMDYSTRNAIYRDRLLLNTESRAWVTLEAGYGDNLTLICLGWINECYSIRQETDVITIIDVIDPDILTSYTGVTFEPNTTFSEAYKYLVSQFSNLKQGELGDLTGEFLQPTIFDGNTFTVINTLTGGHTFVDNGKIHTLGDNETLSNYGVYLIESETGLLETPRRRDATLEIVMLFEPTIRVGQMIEIKADSSTGYRFNGQYKVIGLTHECTISGAIEGTRRTVLQLQYIDFLTSTNENLTNNPAGSPPSIVENNKIKPIKLKISSAANSIYKYIKEHNGAVPKENITNRITWWEMFYSHSKNTPAQVKSSVTKEILNNCELIANELTRFLNDHYPGKSIVIHSGYRTAQNNTNTEGSANKSNHLYGKAIDFHIVGVPVKEFTAEFKKYWKLGLGTYSWGLHVSTNPKERFKGS